MIYEPSARVPTSHVHAVVLQVLAAVVARLLFWVREHAEGLAHLLELLLLFLLHLGTSCAVSV